MEKHPKAAGKGKRREPTEPHLLFKPVVQAAFRPLQALKVPRPFCAILLPAVCDLVHILVLKCSCSPLNGPGPFFLSAPARFPNFPHIHEEPIRERAGEWHGAKDLTPYNS